MEESRGIRPAALGCVLACAALLIGSPAGNAAASDGPPYLMEFLDPGTCGDQGYLLTYEELGPFSGLVTVELCEVRFRQAAGEEFVYQEVKGAGHPSRAGTPDVPVVRFYLAGPPGPRPVFRSREVSAVSVPDILIGPLQPDFDESTGPSDD